MTQRVAAGAAVLVLLVGGAAWAYVSSRGDDLTCGSEQDSYVLLAAGEWEARDADVSANNAFQPNVAWYAEYRRDVPPPPGAFASTQSLVVHGHRTGLDETIERLFEELGGPMIEFTDTKVDGQPAKIGTTGGRSDTSLLLVEVRDDYTIQLLSSEAEPEVLIKAAGQLNPVCHDEWVEAMQFEPEEERP